MGKTVRILSIDGGGVRGVMPALLLDRLERITNKPIHQSFDLITGTSTGGILACALTKPNPPSASHMADVYIREAHEIFTTSVARRLGSLFSAPKYDATVLERVLYQQLGDAWLSQSLTNVLIPSYDLERRTALFFKSWHAKASPDHDYPIREVARATSAAPTFFPPTVVISDSGIKHACIDGSLVANNPAMCAIASARHLWPDAERTVLLSLGVGEQNNPFSFRDAVNWGRLAWAAPAIDIMMDGITETVDYQIREAMSDHMTYLRIQTQLGLTAGSPSDAIDDGSSQNIARLVTRGMDLADRYEDEMVQLAKML